MLAVLSKENGRTQPKDSSTLAPQIDLSGRHRHENRNVKSKAALSFRQLGHRLVLCLVMLAAMMLIVTAAEASETGQHNPAAPRTEARPVFAHYMTCFGSTVDFYKQEIELAQRHGIDGFALNCGEWMVKDKKSGQWTDGAYVKSAEKLYEAAKQLDSGFKLFFSADVNNLRDLTVNMSDMVTRFYDHPNQFRHGDKRVLSAWAGTPATYREVIDKLKAQGREVCFVPFVYSPKFKMAWSYETALEFFQDQPHMDGLFYFAADDSVNGILRRNAIGRRVTQRLGKIFMAGAAPAYNSPNLRDFKGMEGYGAMWEGIIRDGADWVELVTWNDYNEDSNLMPFRWPNGQERRYFNRDEAYLDATAYYSAWFKSGRQPLITQDKLYICYRNRSVWQRQVWNETQKVWEDVVLAQHRPAEQPHDDVRDYVYITTFLTAPATLTVELAGKTHRFEQPAGIAHASVPLVPGVPRVTLTRSTSGKESMIDVVGRKQIIGEATTANSVKGMHLANRTWMSGAVVGAGLRLAVADGKLAGGAVVETVDGKRVVRNVEVDGSGVTIPVTGLKTATYNLRVTYRNTSDSEARLTLTADGPPRSTKEFPHYIPLWLPPTGKSSFATTTFLWSLYETTTHLDVRWRAGTTWADKPAPEDNDRGSVQIEAIELIKVEPVTISKLQRDLRFPELVPIPGGTFAMGTDQGKPDERPAHQVTLAPFAMGKYEVTNEEYERFDPQHRRHRDGYSWRDREPVIYVSWIDGVRYCNWLSEQAGLTPAYVEVVDEKTKAKQWKVNLQADGFHMPTEAQWEYVASGRGEGRKYPWGHDEPVPGKHGNFKGDKALKIDTRVPSDGEGGVLTVGAFPAGASRDGVMDLAGNVVEWCSDWFAYYSPESKSDPCQQTPSPYRSIRGSSWDYYGCGLTVTDREFNSPGFPGYIYIGLRVVLPDAGFQKLVKNQVPTEAK
jgi:glucan endo-1,3-alpha-glucosidase